jgi:uncharacterized protein (DUF362 family)
MDRRKCVQALAGVLAASAVSRADEAGGGPGIPGPYRGKVIAVQNSRCLRKGAYQFEPIQAMVSRGMCELTGAPEAPDAWRKFFAPGDVVGIKLNPVGRPFVCSSPEMLRAIVEGLQSAGVKPSNIVVYERYLEIIDDTGLQKWLPEGVRLAHASLKYDGVQQDIDGYDPEHYVELPFTLPGYDVNDKKAIRSYAALFLTQQVDKLINLPVLKSHNGAGVTLALKNLSHGLVNNVCRSHEGPNLRIAEFTPAVVSMPVIRQKTVLNILDATRGLYHGGPGIMRDDFVWEHKTVYFGTDPVAIDRVGLNVIEAQRKKKRLRPVGAYATDELWTSPYRQPEHIDNAGKAGLGEADLAKIDLKAVSLG